MIQFENIICCNYTMLNIFYIQKRYNAYYAYDQRFEDNARGYIIDVKYWFYVHFRS